MNRHLLTLAGTLALTSAATAQFAHRITYVDADCATNTTLADGTAYTPVASTSGTDNEWALRLYGNGGTVLTSHDVTGSTEDTPMLRTTISGLIPTLSYFVYSYHWSDSNTWRLRARVDTAIPAPPIQGWNAVHFQTSAFAPSQPLALGSYAGYGQVSLDLNFDAAGYETSGHFYQPAGVPAVMIQEGNRFLFEDWLGVYEADLNGEIHVYVDDLEGTQGTGNRTWYDGVGFEIAPFQTGAGCGSPVPTIGFQGAPIMNTTFTATVSGAPANSLALCLIGLNNSNWASFPLPLDLSIFGIGGGCMLQTSIDGTAVAFTDATGFGSFALTIPAIPNPLNLYWQWGVIDAAQAVSATGALETVFHR